MVQGSFSKCKEHYCLCIVLKNKLKKLMAACILRFSDSAPLCPLWSALSLYFASIQLSFDPKPSSFSSVWALSWKGFLVDQFLEFLDAWPLKPLSPSNFESFALICYCSGQNQSLCQLMFLVGPQYFVISTSGLLREFSYSSSGFSIFSPPMTLIIHRSRGRKCFIVTWIVCVFGGS